MPEPIDPRLARALDAFTVPGLPADFADRLAAQAQALPDVPPLPRRRPGIARRWWRVGASGLSAVVVGVVSISAAAMGYLGEPISHAVHAAPVIGHVVERVIPEHRRVHHPAPVHLVAVAQPQPTPLPAASFTPPPDERPVAHPFLRRAIARLHAMPPERRRIWLDNHPRIAERLAERRERRLARRALANGFDAPENMRPGVGPLQQQRRFERREWRREQRLLRQESGAPNGY